MPVLNVKRGRLLGMWEKGKSVRDVNLYSVSSVDNLQVDRSMAGEGSVDDQNEDEVIVNTARDRSLTSIVELTRYL